MQSDTLKNNTALVVYICIDFIYIIWSKSTDVTTNRRSFFIAFFQPNIYATLFLIYKQYSKVSDHSIH